MIPAARFPRGLAVLLSAVVAMTALGAVADEAPPVRVEPTQYDKPRLPSSLQDALHFVRVDEARDEYKVRGRGLTAAVVDSGLRTTHVDFKGRVLAAQNFSGEGKDDDVTDEVGTGTSVCGIIAGADIHTGVAPEAQVIPLKVTSRGGVASWVSVERALGWVIEHHKQHRISVVIIGVTDSGNYGDENQLPANPLFRSIRDQIRELRKARVAVVAPAGNRFDEVGRKPGMSFPAIVRETVSVGAVFEKSSGPGTMAPYSQRLHPSVNRDSCTDVFAPGSLVASSGTRTDIGESFQHGTHHAAAFAAGTILLLQQFYLRVDKKELLPPVEYLEDWLRRGSIPLPERDGAAPADGPTYPRLHAVGALSRAQRQNQREFLQEKR